VKCALKFVVHFFLTIIYRCWVTTAVTELETTRALE